MNRSKLLAWMLCLGPTGLVFAQQPKTTPLATQPEPTTMSVEGRLYRAIQSTPVDESISVDEQDRKIAKIYRDYARFLELDRSKDRNKADGILRNIVAELQSLLTQPGITDLMPFRDMYRTAIRTTKDFYGKVDPSLVAENDEVFELRAEVIAELETDDNSNLLENVNAPSQLGLAPVNTVFQMDLERPVLRAISSLSRNKTHFRTVRTRADLYFPMIERILEEEGLPDEIKYLAVVESALNPRAQSWAAAAGLWQFIPATGAGYGLNINNAIDERRDPEKATRAAARHLRDLHQMFGGDWQLALAGYNCNPYRVKRALEQASQRLGRKATFWEIMDKLPRETRNYVPLFIATYLIMNNQQAFDLGAYPQAPLYEYDVVAVQGGATLDEISDKLQIPITHIRALNPELKTDKVPSAVSASFMPDRILLGNGEMPEQGYLLRVPKNTGSGLGDLALGTPLQVSYGARTGTLAQRTENPLESLASVLPSSRDRVRSRPEPKTSPTKPDGSQPSSVFSSASAGDMTLAPAAAPTPAVAAIADLTPAPPKTKVTKPAPKPQERQVAAPKGKRQVVKVKPGQTLTQLATQYGVEASDIKEWNNLRHNQINVGQRIVIFSDAKPEEPGAREVAAARESSKRTTSKTKTTAAPSSHRVAKGEGLTSIARKYGMTVSELKSVNNLKSNTINPGDILRIKGGKTADPKGTKANTKSTKKEKPTTTKKKRR
ncbi:MAG TPA: LysM peptidoglycan-binding domain-containing protein [Rhodothermales bacterium]|nr:LysM peptidoglycan-binding domain-containing protein [Rhodothermales bacterium]HRR09654.1 LysM peptidoglycan-binding domain-containing protein [Rhodothermales bacterium]